MNPPDSSDERNPVEALAEEFAERRRRGERPSLHEYTERYPQWAGEIRDLFPALCKLEEVRPQTGDATGEYVPAGGPGPMPFERLGDYRLLRLVGRGGMGVVYEAEQESLGRRVALKILPESALPDPQRLLRFEREARAAARLHHTNIVPVFGVGAENGVRYYVMQFIQGQGLDQVLLELQRLRVSPANVPPATPSEASRVAQSLLAGPFAAHHAEPAATSSDSAPSLPGQSVGGSKTDRGRQYAKSVALIGVQVAEALDYADAQGILHRDVKPSNLLLDVQGTVWVADFGLAKTHDSDDLTGTGDVVGTLRYMAPERFQGQADVRSDVYSLGLTLFELLALRPAFDETDRHKLIRQVTQREPPRLGKLNPAVPRDLETVIHKAIAREPGRRYQSARELAEDLQRFVQDRPVRARRVGAAERFGRWCRRNPVLAATTGLAAAALVAAAVVAALYALSQGQRAEEQEQAYRDLLAEQKRTKSEKDRAEKLAGDLGAALTDSRRQAALTAGERARGLIEQDDPYQAMLWLARGVELAPERDDSLQQILRQELALVHTRLPALKEARTFPGPANGIEFSADGRTLLTSFTPFIATPSHRLWDMATGRPKGELFRLPGTHSVVALSPDGKWLYLAASRDEAGRSKIQLLDGVTGQPREPAPAAGDAHPTAAAFSPDGRALALVGFGVATGKTVAKRWDLAAGRVVGPTLLLPGKCTYACFDREGKLFLAVCQLLPRADVELQVWDWDAGRCLHRQLLKRTFPPAVRFSPDGRWALVRNATPWLKDPELLLDLRTGRSQTVPLETRGRATAFPETADVPGGRVAAAAAFSPDGKSLATGDTNPRTGLGQVRLWDVATRQPLGPPPPHPVAVRAVAFGPDGRTLVVGGSPFVGGSDARVRIWELPAGPWRTDGVPNLKPASLFSPDGNVVVEGSLTRPGKRAEVRCRILGSGAAWGLPVALSARVRQVAVSADGSTLAAVLPDILGVEVHFWDLASGKEKGRYARILGSVDRLALSPDGKWLGTLGNFNDGMAQVQLWDSASGRRPHPPLLVHGQTGLAELAVSPDGETVLIAAHGTPVQLWDVRSARPLGRPLEIGVGQVRAAFSAGGALLVSAADDLVQFWDSRTGQALGLALAHPKRVEHLFFSPGGGTVFAFGSGRLCRYDVPRPVRGTSKAVVAWVESLYGQRLTPEGQVFQLPDADWQTRRPAGAGR